jgi:hypothetical protein
MDDIIRELIYEIRVLQNILAFMCLLLFLHIIPNYVIAYQLIIYRIIAKEHHETVKDAVNKKE